MVAHCVRESPLECCGILGGNPPRVSSIHPLRNELKSETRYFADPSDLFTTHIALRERDADILAIYHSHPRWQAVPSKTDLAENYYGPCPRIIVSLRGEVPEVRVWRLDPEFVPRTSLADRRARRTRRRSLRLQGRLWAY